MSAGALAAFLVAVAATGVRAAGQAAGPVTRLAAGAETDIRGPMGPVEPPRADPHRWLKRGLVSAVAVGFVLTAFHFIRRREGRASVQGQGGGARAIPALPDGLEGMDAAEFYARLLSAARAALGDGALASTPRELAASALPGDADWRALCARAEQALYARATVAPDDMHRDLETARRVLAEFAAEDADEL